MSDAITQRRCAPAELGLLAIDDGLAAPFGASDLKSILDPLGVAVVIMPSSGICHVCGEGACDHHGERIAEAGRQLDSLGRHCRRVAVAGAGSAAALALLLAAERPQAVDACVLVRPRLGLGAPRESLLDKWLRRLAWPRCILVGEPPPRRPASTSPGHPGSPGEIAVLGPRLAGIRQPVLIIHPRSRDCCGLDDAWLLQRRLAGIVEMLTPGEPEEAARAALGSPAVARLAGFLECIAGRALPHRGMLVPPDGASPPSALPAGAT
jgi:pimeloyl-ACP methyl ester carboxylesterase